MFPVFYLCALYVKIAEPQNDTTLDLESPNSGVIFASVSSVSFQDNQPRV